MNISIQQIEYFVRTRMQGEGSGHDWFHADRVRNVALGLAKQEGGCDLEVVEASALLHDIADRKLHPDPILGMLEIHEQLIKAGFVGERCKSVLEIITNISYRGAGTDTPMKTLEGRVVQDADRLDAMGAIGIARCFAYGGKKGRLLYDPSQPPVLHGSQESYHNDQGPSLNHFYEKLLLLKDRMLTESGKKAAAERHRFLEEYVARFLKEWCGQDLPN
jgi:uncharacterized protein